MKTNLQFFIFCVLFLVFIEPKAQVSRDYNIPFDTHLKTNLDFHKTDNFSSNRNKLVSLTGQFYLPDTLILCTTTDSFRLSASYTLDGSESQRLTQVRYNGYWANYLKETWMYFDENGSNITLEQIWSGGTWTNSTLDSSTYDANGNMLVHLFRYWSQDAWKDSLLSFRSYDANGYMLSNLGQVWKNNHWENYDRSTYTYDGMGNQLTDVFELWATNAWENSMKRTSTYDGNGKKLTYLYQYWSNSQWNNDTYITYTYNGNGNLLTTLLQIWAGNIWKNSGTRNYTYDSNGYLATELYKTWYNDTEWRNTDLYTYTNDQDGNVLNILWQKWAANLWSNWRQSDYTYDSHGNATTGYNTEWFNSSWVPTDYTFIVWFNDEEYYFDGYSINISYILITTDVSDNFENSVKHFNLSQNYPNPFNPSTKLRYSIPSNVKSQMSKVVLKVFDILGNEAALLVNEEQEARTHEVEFHAANLPSGVYFYSLEVNGFSQTRKMILLK